MIGQIGRAAGKVERTHTTYTGSHVVEMVDGVVLTRSQVNAHAATQNTNINKTTCNREWHQITWVRVLFMCCPPSWSPHGPLLKTSPRITWYTLVDHNSTGRCTLL